MERCSNLSIGFFFEESFRGNHLIASLYISTLSHFLCSQHARGIKIFGQYKRQLGYVPFLTVTTQSIVAPVAALITTRSQIDTMIGSWMGMPIDGSVVLASSHSNSKSPAFGNHSPIGFSIVKVSPKFDCLLWVSCGSGGGWGPCCLQTTIVVIVFPFVDRFLKAGANSRFGDVMT